MQNGQHCEDYFHCSSNNNVDGDDVDIAKVDAGRGILKAVQEGENNWEYSAAAAGGGIVVTTGIKPRS